jgi:uncharacterized membrane protein YqgA involved in biofilm formation
MRKKIIQNIKDPITDIIGLIIIILTIVERYQGEVQWLWEGAAGLTLGTALFIMPDKWLQDSIESVKKKFTDTKTE